MPGPKPQPEDVADLAGLSDAEALDAIGHLIDEAGDHRDAALTDRAFRLLDQIAVRELSDELTALTHYFRANAWSNRAHEACARDVWAWEQPEIQAEILELRRAVRHPGFLTMPEVRQCQILTNLANELNSIGRTIEAIQLWDQALALIDVFAMAHANRGNGLLAYARSLYDPGHRNLIAAEAHAAFERAVAESAFFDSGEANSLRSRFSATAEDIAAHIDLAAAGRLDLKRFSLGRSATERRYRSWCLSNRLFINPLNELGTQAISATDVLTLPNLTTTSTAQQMPTIIGFFNQMKQEFASARLLFYEGINSEGLHFSDRRVFLYNTFDYPVYGLAIEKIRTAYRISYSIFDKIAYFLNRYLMIGHDPRRVSFRNVWYERRRTPRLLPRFTNHPNWPLRGLFWLSKDLFEDEFQRVTAPDAEALAETRNHLEHRYLHLTEFGQALPRGERDWEPLLLGRNEFEARTIALMQRARAGLIYLALAVYREECLRADENSAALVLELPFDVWEDEWKR